MLQRERRVECGSMRPQRLAILEHARTGDSRIDDFIDATASGQGSATRMRLDWTDRLSQGTSLGIGIWFRVMRWMFPYLLRPRRADRSSGTLVAASGNRTRLEGGIDSTSCSTTSWSSLTRLLA